MRRKPYQAIQEAYAAGWDVIRDPSASDGGFAFSVVTHRSDPGPEADDRPYIFDALYDGERAGWRAVVRYLAKMGPTQ